jgi:peptide/nickel transport system permease protein
MGFGRFLLRRLALTLPTLFGVVVIGFLLTRLLPGNPALVVAGAFATPDYIAEVERAMGLDQPLPVQFWRYLAALAQGDLGMSSATGRPVLADFLQRLPATLELTLAALLLAVGLGIPLGVLAAVHRDTAIDHLGRLVSVLGVAMPSFWTGLLLIYLFFYLLNWAPAPLGRISPSIAPPATITGMYVPDALLTLDLTALASALRQLVLPAATLGIAVLAPVARMTRATMLEVLQSDHVKAAWAAGLPWRAVVYGDALRCALIPVVTILGVVFGFLLAGNAVVESVFAWPGIGNYAVTALVTKDSAPIQSFVLFVAVMYVLVNLLVDLLYGWIDPRIRLG